MKSGVYEREKERDRSPEGIEPRITFIIVATRAFSPSSIWESIIRRIINKTVESRARCLSRASAPRVPTTVSAACSNKHGRFRRFAEHGGSQLARELEWVEWGEWQRKFRLCAGHGRKREKSFQLRGAFAFSPNSLRRAAVYGMAKGEEPRKRGRGRK